ncbi:unnamed protein product [Cuscuta europaea]|uniref:CCHC-type domain-containing protein n=1 Tax=Cuscuta europaea TaxID=41803 RepID=A0A9P1EIF3_CUSEU|nr:unnamed protein product [Cuscuta europaea]
MTVQDYHSQFVSLAEFASSLVPDEESKVEKFIRGLNYDTQKALSVQECQTLDDTYYRAAKHYRVIQLQREAHKKIRKNEEENKAREKRFKTHQHDQQPTWKREDHPQEGKRFPGQGPRQEQRYVPRDRHYHCKLCQRDHPGVDCDGKVVSCFTCGKRGHRAFECLNKGNASHQNQRPNQGGANQGGNQGGDRPRNHDNNNRDRDANQNKNQNQGAGNQGNQGRIYVMNQAQARAHDVVSGEYLEAGTEEER